MSQTSPADDSPVLSLLRDYGLTLGLLVVSGLLLWRSTLPEAEENRALEFERVRLEQQVQRHRERLEKLEALDRAGPDPLVLERMAREYFGALVLPEGESLVDPEAPGGEPTIPRE